MIVTECDKSTQVVVVIAVVVVVVVVIVDVVYQTLPLTLSY